VSIHLRVADSTFLRDDVALIDHLNKKLLPVVCSLMPDMVTLHKWLQLIIVGKAL